MTILELRDSRTMRDLIDLCPYCMERPGIYKHYSDYACEECAESDPFEETYEDGRVYRNGVRQYHLVAELIAWIVLSGENES